jgi:hypothetical protein
MPLYYL